MRMKKATILFCALMLFASCGNASGQNNNAVQDAKQTESIQIEDTETKKEKSMQEIYEEIINSIEFPEMLVAKENYISNYYGIDPDILEDYVFASASDVVCADTVILVKLKDEKHVDAVRDSLEGYLEDQKREMKNYLPELYQLIEKSEIHTSGIYIYLVISESEEEIQDIIAQYIS